MPTPAQAFGDTLDAAQRSAGVIAARHRGDFAGAENLLTGLDDPSRAAGGLFLADLAIALLAHAEGREVDAVAGEISLQLAAQRSTVGET